MMPFFDLLQEILKSEQQKKRKATAAGKIF